MNRGTFITLEMTHGFEAERPLGRGQNATSARCRQDGRSRSISIRILLLTAASLLALPARGSDVKIRFDTTAADAILDMLSRPVGSEVSDADIDRVAAMPGNEAIVNHAAPFIPAATTAKLKQDLRTMVTAGALMSGSFADDPFGFGDVKKHLRETKALMQRLRNEEKEIVAGVTQLIAGYSPPESSLDVTVYFVAGGRSIGFAGSNAFYIGVDSYLGDFDSMRLTMAHELYHNVQRAGWQAAGYQQPREVDSLAANVTQCLLLLHTTYEEGTASLFDRFYKDLPAGEFSGNIQSVAKRNEATIQDNFTLLELMLYRLYHDRTLSDNYIYDRLYGLGFILERWGVPFYVLGYRIASIIEKYDGKAGIARLIGKSPVVFFQRYVSLTKAHPDDKEIVPFDKVTQAMFETLEIERQRKSVHRPKKKL